MKTRYALLVIAAVSILIFANSFLNAFQYDDQVYLEENTHIKTIGLPDIFLKPSALFAPNTTSGHYRPLVLFSYVINYRVHGLNPVGYHGVNLAFHIGAAFLVFLIMKAMFENTASSKQAEAALFVAFTAAIIFSVHPFNSEAVNYITARSSILSGFFYLLAFYWWVRFRQGEGFSNLLPVTSKFYLGSLLAFLLGMLSKEVVITLPVVLWLYDLYFYTPHSTTRTSRFLDYRMYVSYLPFVLVVIVPALYIRILYWGGIVPPLKGTIQEQFYTGLPVLVKYLKLFVFPVGLNIDHQNEVYSNFFTLPVAVSALILAVYVVLIYLARRSGAPAWRVVSFFMIWFFIVLIPVLAVPLNVVFQENRGYMAIMVFTVFAGVVMGKLYEIAPKRYAFALLIVLISLFSAGTVYRNGIWRDGVSLWSDAVAKSPESSRAHTNLGTEYATLGRYEKAIENLRKALRLTDPEKKTELANIHYNIGAVYQQMGRNDMALEEYRRVTELSPPDFRPWYNLGVLYQQAGKDETALEAYKNALMRNPADFRSYHNVGLLYQNRGEMELAAGYYRKALSINPGYVKSRVNLEAIYGQERR